MMRPGTAKLSRRSMSLLSLVIGIVSTLLPSCTTKGTIQASSIDTLVTKVTARHDAYVKADTTISEADKTDFLRSSEILRMVVAEAEKGADASSTSAAPTK